MASKDNNNNNNNNLEMGDENDKSTKALQETLQFVSKSLLPSIEMFGSNEDSYSHDDGLDFLHVKNSLLLSYLIDLTVYCREQHAAASGSSSNNNKSSSKNDNKDASKTTLQRLNEIKVVLDKMRGLDKKLRYQIDKLLAAGANATSFAAAGDNDNDNENNNGGRATTSYHPEDPLQFRPNPRSLARKDNSDDSNSDDDKPASRHQGDQDDSNSDDDEDDDDDEVEKDDDDLQAAKATLSMARAKKSGKKHKNGRDDDDDDNDNDGLYRAPRMASVPYAHDVERKQAQKEKQSKRRMRASELALMLKSEYGDAPEQEDVHGGGDFGKQKAAARRMAEKEAEKTKFEESTMVRLAISRQDKKDQKRLMRQEHSNLSAISSNLSNLVDDASFGIKGMNGNGGDDDDDEDMYPPRYGNKKPTKGKGGKRNSGGGFGASSSSSRKNATKRRKTK